MATGPELMTMPLLVTAITCLGSIVITVAVLAGTGGLIYFVMKSARQDQGVLKEGIPAQATIVNAWQTGMYINNQPQVGMLLEVRPPGGAPYQAEAKAVVPIMNIHQFQPGALLNVKISRTDPSKVALDIYG